MAGAFGTVIVISMIGIPPAWMASTARRASSTLAARTTGMMPISWILLIAVSMVTAGSWNCGKQIIGLSLFLGERTRMSRGTLRRALQVSSGIYGQPGHGTESTEDSSKHKRIRPAEMHGDYGSQYRRDASSQLRAHVHEPGSGARAPASDIGGD